jgi:hypothetical protein
MISNNNNNNIVYDIVTDGKNVELTNPKAFLFLNRHTTKDIEYNNKYF